MDRLSPPAATSRGQRGRHRHQRDVTGAEDHRNLTEGHLGATAARLTAVCVRTVVHAHLRDGHAQRGLHLTHRKRFKQNLNLKLTKSLKIKQNQEK